MNLYADIPGSYDVMLVFLDILILFLTAYMVLRFIRRITILTAAVLMLQLCVLTTGLLAFFNRAILVPLFEMVLVLLGVVLPSVFVLYDYLNMKRRIAESGNDAPLIPRLGKKAIDSKFNSFVKDALDWGAEAQEGMISASLKIKDKHFKDGFMQQIHLAHKLIKNQKLRDALNIYRILSGIARDNPCVAYNTAWLMRKLELYKESFDFHKKALDLLKKSEHINENKENKQEQNRDWDNGTLMAMAYFGCGICCYEMKKYEQAIEQFTLARDHMLELREAEINIAKSHITLGNLEEAERHIRSALEEKEEFRLRYLMAEICFEKSRDMECKYHLEKVIEAEEDFMEAWVLLGKVCRKTGDWKGAETAYRKLTQIDPQDADHFYRLGISQRQEGKTEEALSNFKMAADINPKHSRSLYSMASVYDAQGKFDKAIESLTQSLNGDEKLEMAYNLLAEIYISRDRVYEAVRVYEEASAEHPESYIILYNLGVTLMMVKHYEEAIRAFRCAHRLTSDDPALYYNWASAAIALKNYSEAARLYKEGLRYKPDDDEILFGLARISALSGDIDAAIAFLSQSFDINPGLRLRAKASHDFASLRTLKAFRDITNLPVREERLDA